MSNKIQTFHNMIGLVMADVSGKRNDDEMIFFASNGKKFLFKHYQDCCESVWIEDICGDLDDLIGSPILEAEEISSEEYEIPNIDNQGHSLDVSTSYWTFYRFSTAKGSVTVRWLGTSNGYYSTDVSYSEI